MCGAGIPFKAAKSPSIPFVKGGGNHDGSYLQAK
jgi:hypothetical protein